MSNLNLVRGAVTGLSADIPPQPTRPAAAAATSVAANTRCALFGFWVWVDQPGDLKGRKSFVFGEGWSEEEAWRDALERYYAVHPTHLVSKRFEGGKCVAVRRGVPATVKEAA